jgi:hypothetical protein
MAAVGFICALNYCGMQLFLLGRRVKLLPGYRSVVGMLLIAAVAFSQVTSASLAPSVGAQSS